MTWNDVWIKLADALIPLVALALTAALAMLGEWFRSKAKQVKQDTLRESLMAAILEGERVASDAILATNQVFVDDLKRRAQDGKLTGDQAMAAMEHASEYFINHITPGAFDVLEAAYGPWEAWLEDYLEAKLAESKGAWYGAIEAVVDPLSSEAS